MRSSVSTARFLKEVIGGSKGLWRDRLKTNSEGPQHQHFIPTKSLVSSFPFACLHSFPSQPFACGVCILDFALKFFALDAGLLPRLKRISLTLPHETVGRIEIALNRIYIFQYILLSLTVFQLKGALLGPQVPESTYTWKKTRRSKSAIAGSFPEEVFIPTLRPWDHRDPRCVNASVIHVSKARAVGMFMDRGIKCKYMKMQ